MTTRLTPVALFLALLSTHCAGLAAQHFYGRQCNLPAAIVCAIDTPDRQSRCQTLVLQSVHEINRAARGELLVYAQVPGAIPVAFVHDINALIHAPAGAGRIMGLTVPRVVEGGCIYGAIIALDDSLLEGWDAPWAPTVTTHEVLHAIGLDHDEAGIMTPSVTDASHSQHVSPAEAAALREYYRNR